MYSIPKCCMISLDGSPSPLNGQYLNSIDIKIVCFFSEICFYSFEGNFDFLRGFFVFGIFVWDFFEFLIYFFLDGIFEDVRMKVFKEWVLLWLVFLICVDFPSV